MEKTINVLIKESHQIAVEHGWWDKPKTMGELLVLIHSEVSEALEEHRNGKEPTETYYSGKSTTYFPELENGDKCTEIFYSKTESEMVFQDAMGEEVIVNKPEGIPSELADIVIRVFDICGYYGIDLEAAIEEKMEYNESRPYKHGGKKL